MNESPKAKRTSGPPQPISKPGLRKRPARPAAMQSEERTKNQMAPYQTRGKARQRAEEPQPQKSQQKSGRVDQDKEFTDTDPLQSAPQTQEIGQDDEVDDSGVSDSSGEEDDPQSAPTHPTPKPSRRGAEYHPMMDQEDDEDEDEDRDVEIGNDGDNPNDDEIVNEGEGGHGGEIAESEHGNDNEEVEDETQQHQHRPSDDRSDKGVATEAETSQELIEAERSIRAAAIPDLAYYAAKHAKRLRDLDTNAKLVGLMSITGIPFESLRTSLFSGPGTDAFITWNPSSVVNPETGHEVYPQWDLGRVNLVTALDTIQRLRWEPDNIPALHLQSLDGYFAKLGDPFDERPGALDVALDIRTLRAIEALKTRKTREPKNAVIANLFCEPNEGHDEAYRLGYGPYKDIGDSPEFFDSYADRAQKLVELSKPKKGKDAKQALEALKAAFPFDKLLAGAKDWVLTLYKNTEEKAETQRQSNRQSVSGNSTERQSPTRSGPDEYHDAPEGLPYDDTESAVESQPIVRFEGIEQSLFNGSSSIRALQQRTSTPNRNPPPSNQQQQQQQRQHHAIPGNPPRDYADHSNANILMQSSAPMPSSLLSAGNRHTLPRHQGPVASSSSARRRRSAPGQNGGGSSPDDDNDAEDPFENDTRVQSPNKRARLEEENERAKRQRISSASHAPSQRQSHTPSAPQSRHDETLEHPERQRIRIKWSRADSELLLDLIDQYDCAWTAIERNHEEDFEVKRNHQAFRDKARNMKVDYLLRDQPLPSKFDMVALGPKEIAKVRSFGKNPNRREDDFDDNGRIINTEYRPMFGEE